MKSRQCPPPTPRQLDLLTDAARSQGLSPDERREAITLLAGLLIEAGSAAGSGACDDRG